MTDFLSPSPLTDAVISISYESVITKFYFSRMILARKSEYFAGLYKFGGDRMDEPILNVSPLIFTYVLCFINDGQLDIFDDEMYNLLISAADYFRINSLKEHCCEYLFTVKCNIAIGERVRAINEHGSTKQHANLQKLFVGKLVGERPRCDHLFKCEEPHFIPSPWCIQLASELEHTSPNLIELWETCQYNPNALWFVIQAILGIEEITVHRAYTKRKATDDLLPPDAKKQRID